MKENLQTKKSLTKVISITIFTFALLALSLLVLPYELFLFSALVIMFAIRCVEKEVCTSDLHKLSSFALRMKEQIKA